MVLPVGMSKDEQILLKVRKGRLKIHYEEIYKVRFVPLIEGVEKK